MHRFNIIWATVWATAVLSGTVQAQAPQQAGAFSTIQGNALNSTNGPLPTAVVRLRDARFGGIVDRRLTDRSGLFAFRALDPGSYVVELVANEQTILAASQVLSVNAGEVASAIVRLPFRIASFAGILGQSTAQATTIISAAVASGVLAADVTVDAVSPE